MNYIGSKHSLSSFITNTIFQTIGRKSGFVFAEIFGGTGAVAREIKPLASKVIANDLEAYSYALLRNYIGNHKKFEFQSLLRELSVLPEKEGFLYQNYGEKGSDRLYFSSYNAQKIDAIRSQIENWSVSKKISEDQYYFLLATLLEAADKVANTASVYGAFLKKLKASALKPLRLVPANFVLTENKHDVYNKDANELIKSISGDVLYLDPPYNQRQYGANYHLLNTIALYDQFVPQGKTGLRDYNRSQYCARNKAASALEEIVKEADFEYIFLSYNNEGLLNLNDVEAILSSYGTYGLASTDYSRFKADKTESRNHIASSTVEYLHVLRKGSDKLEKSFLRHITNKKEYNLLPLFS